MVAALLFCVNAAGAGTSGPETDDDALLAAPATALSDVHHSYYKPPAHPCPVGPWMQSGRVVVTEPPCNISATTAGKIDVLPQMQACARLASQCGAALVFPPGKYWLNGSLNLTVSTLFSRDGGLTLESESGQGDVTLCRCPGCIDSRCGDVQSPTVAIGDAYPPTGMKGYEGTSGVTLRNLGISGVTTAVRIINAAGIRLQSCRLSVGKVNVMVDDLPATAPLAIANSFEVFVDDCEIYNAGEPRFGGTRPSVLMRGLPDGRDHGQSRVPYVYIVRFARTMFVLGGVTYIQLAQLDNVAAVDFGFMSCNCEQINMPMFQVISVPEVRLFRMELVTITDFVSWDAGSANPGSKPSPIVSFNGAHPNHTLDGVTITGSGTPVDIPALTVLGGSVSGVTLLDGHWYGGVDATGADHAVSWVSRSSGGFVLAGNGAEIQAGDFTAATRSASTLDGHSQHALLGGISGEKNARWSLDADGISQWGSGGGRTFDTRVGRPRALVVAWDPPPIEGKGGSASLNVSLSDTPHHGASSGDMVQVSHEGLQGQLVLLSAHVVSSADVVVVVALNAGAALVDLPNATLRLLLTPVDAI